MKTRNLSHYVVASTVVVCSLLLCSTLVFALTGFRLQQPSRTLEIDFRNVSGIGPGTAVMYAGSPAGSVLRLRHLTPEERRQSDDPTYVLRATLEIQDDLPALTDDVRSGIATDSLLGDKFIALLPGTATAPPLAEGTVLRATEAELMEVVQRLGNNLDSISSRLAGDYGRVIPQITGLLDRTSDMVGESTSLLRSLNVTAKDAQDLMNRVNLDYQSTYNPRIEAILADVQNIGTNVNLAVRDVNVNTTLTLNEARALLEANRDNLTTLIAELRVVSQNLKVISTYTKALTLRLGEKPSRLLWSRSRELPAEEDIIQSDEPIAIPRNKSGE